MSVQEVSLWRSDGAKIVDINVDLILSEAHKKKATVVQIPLEDGSVVSDHVIIQPVELTISAHMSNIDGNNAPAVGEKAKTAWEALTALYTARQPVEVTTSHELYSSMVVSALDGTNTAPYNGQLSITATFTEISPVKLVRSAVSPSPKGKSKNTASSPTSTTQTSGAPKEDGSVAYKTAKGMGL